MSDDNFGDYFCLTCQSRSCEHLRAGQVTILDCEHCAESPTRGICRLCAIHGCEAGCGDCALGDGRYCGGEDGEICDVYGKVAEA